MNILISIVLLIVALSFILVYANTHPPKYPLYIPPSEYRMNYEAVSFTTEDGVALKGWLVEPPHPGAKSPAIILCHGVGANRSDFTELAASLAKRGFFALQFDFRAHGESGGSRTSLGYHEQKDIIAALQFLTTRPGIDPRRIGIYGFSLGGSSAILAAAKTGAFSAVVADSAFTSLRDQAREAITGFYHLPSFPFLHLAVLGYELYFQTQVDAVAPVTVIAAIAPTPVLIIAGEGDDLIPAENGRKLFAAAKEPKDLWVIPHAEHGGTLVAAGNEYEKRVGEFFDRYLKKSQPPKH
jgi:dipeptidyl aminopeptidase/acylaminoacyl peptidase